MSDDKAERRTDRRAPIAVRAQVKGFTSSGDSWGEYVTTVDVSQRGALFPLTHTVDRGQVLLLMLPMPAQYRRYDQGQPLYRVYALVRHTRLTGQDRYVGVRLLGKHPPRDYEKHPACRYYLPGDTLPAVVAGQQHLAETSEHDEGTPENARPSKERRRARRLDVFVDFRIQRLDVSQSERTIAENIGHGGARLLTSLPIKSGEVVRIEEVGGAFATRAEVVNVYVGDDHTLRLNLRFLDGEPPKRLLPDLPD